MRVTYDLSLFAHTIADTRGRTGILRVVANVARELQNLSQFELVWSSFRTQTAFRTRSVIKNSGLSGELVSDGLRYELLGNLESRLRSLDRLTQQKLPGLRFLSSYLARLQIGIESKSWLSQHKTDIWHSPIYPFPQPLQENRPDCIRFFTIYDLIPLKFPEYFAGITKPCIEEVVRSLEVGDWVLCISQATKDDLLAERPDLDPDHIRVTPLAAGENFTPIDDASAIQQLLKRIEVPFNTPYILSVCTLEPRKNLKTVIAAFELLADTDAVLVLVGNMGWDSSELNQLLQAHSRRIKVTGFLSDEQIRLLYSNCHAFVYMSLYEGFGLPPLEAMQCGAPVVCSDNSSLPEVVGEAGILLPALDVEGLSDALRTLLSDGGVRKRMRQQGLERAKQFSWRNTAQLTAKAYADALRS